jgi:tRNA pseudouridine13 synthase
MSELPRWHAEFPQIAGTLKSVPEDFVVEEIPAYEPSGDGEHLFLWIEKRNLSGEEMQRRLARALGIKPHEIGSGGIKDRRAVTRQWLSVPAKLDPLVAAAESDEFRVLKAARHGNKLRTGHLRGNRFSILIRDCKPASDCGMGALHSPLEISRTLVERIATLGFPNYYGEQRFGRDGETAALGFDLLAGRKSPRDIPYSRRKFLLRLSLSAVQSELFNRVLAARLTDGLLATVLAGDVMEVVASGGKFLAEDPTKEQPRCDAGEIVVTGPMFGPKMKQPMGVPAEREAKVLADAGLTLDQFAGFGDLLAGTRRPLVIRPGELLVAEEPAGLRFTFTLPPGVYATTLLAEIMASEGPAHDALCEF